MTTDSKIRIFTICLLNFFFCIQELNKDSYITELQKRDYNVLKFQKKRLNRINK